MAVGQQAAKQDDRVEGIDYHVVMIPSASGLVPSPAPIPHPFKGKIADNVSSDVYIMNKPAATKDSGVQGEGHIPIGGPKFQLEPSNRGQVHTGSSSVFINGKPAARNSDIVMTCNDPVDAPNGIIIADSTVNIG